jgi:cytochrome P460
MMRIAIALGVLYAAAFSFAVNAQQRADDGPRFKEGTTLIRPADYREWVFLSSGVGMTYAANGAPANAPQVFDNVYVNPSSYRAFMQTGGWPDRTIFVLEQRASATEGSINKGGRFQTTLMSTEAHVKDARLPGGWGFFLFGPPAQAPDAVAPMSAAASARCVECHTTNGAVERTFVQFYPTLLEIARAKCTLRPGF